MFYKWRLDREAGQCSCINMESCSPWLQCSDTEFNAHTRRASTIKLAERRKFLLLTPSLLLLLLMMMMIVLLICIASAFHAHAHRHTEHCIFSRWCRLVSIIFRGDDNDSVYQVPVRQVCTQCCTAGSEYVTCTTGDDS